MGIVEKLKPGKVLKDFAEAPKLAQVLQTVRKSRKRPRTDSIKAFESFDIFTVAYVT